MTGGTNLALVGIAVLVMFWVLVQLGSVVSKGTEHLEKIGMAEIGLMLTAAVLVLSNI